MSFFLLGKGPDGDLSLLSGKVYATRQEALAELSVLTADAGFTHWDDEVLLMELTSGTPVLLVRPAMSEVAAGNEAYENTDFVTLADEDDLAADEPPAPEAVDLEPEDASASEQVEPTSEEPEPAPDADLEPEEEAEEAAEEADEADVPDDSELEAPHEETEALDADDAHGADDASDFAEADEPEADMDLEEVAEETPVAEDDTAGTDAEGPDDGDYSDELDNVLLGLEGDDDEFEPVADSPSDDIPAEQEDNEPAQEISVLDSDEIVSEDVVSEAEDVVVREPVSILDEIVILSDGGDPDFGRVVIEEPVGAEDAEAAAEDEPRAEPDADADTGLRDALMRTAFQMESEGIVAPESIGPEAAGDDSEDSGVDAGVPETAEGGAPESAAPVWPWDTVAKDDAFAIPSLEEPAADESPLIHARGDDETLAASRPVILGSYGGDAEDEPQPVDAAEFAPAPTPDADTSPAETVVQQPAPATEPVWPSEAESDAQPEQSAEDAEFVLDLDTGKFVKKTKSAPAGGFTGGAEPMLDMSCDDCVYVQTCPNKDQRDPKTCGSFQWK